MAFLERTLSGVFSQQPKKKFNLRINPKVFENEELHQLQYGHMKNSADYA